jgi:hypothetical protein
MKQVRKCSRKTSLGSFPPKSCSVQVACISKVRSTRSRKYGIQPVPPSDSAIFRSGYSLIGRDHNRSAAAWTMFIGWSVIITSGGESAAGIDSRPDEPMCTDITVFVSHSARQSGFQYSLWKLGYPRAAGFSVNVSEWQPLAATRRTSLAQSSASQIAGSAIGMNRPG